MLALPLPERPLRPSALRLPEEGNVNTERAARWLRLPPSQATCIWWLVQAGQMRRLSRLWCCNWHHVWDSQVRPFLCEGYTVGEREGPLWAGFGLPVCPWSQHIPGLSDFPICSDSGNRSPAMRACCTRELLFLVLQLHALGLLSVILTNSFFYATLHGSLSTDRRSHRNGKTAVCF